jgi:tripartite-type tricarboxylate transporter receptor subunit TctC
LSGLGAIAVLLMADLGASANDAAYPARPIRVVFPFAPGEAADYLPRLMGHKFTETLNVPIITDNRPGAGSIIGIEAGAKARPDGYTFTLVSPAFTVNHSLKATLPYDALEDFSPVVRIAATLHVLVVKPTLYVSTISDLVTSAKAAQRKLSFASVGVGSIAQLEGESLKRDTGLDLVHAPCRGVAMALTDIISNNVNMMFAAIPDVMPPLESGALKALAVTGPSRSALLPNVPSMIESGFKEFVFEAWFGLVAPRKIPQDAIDKINGETRRVLRDRDVVEKLKAQGLEPVDESPAGFGQFLRHEVEKYKKIIVAVGIQPE